MVLANSPLEDGSPDAVLRWRVAFYLVEQMMQSWLHSYRSCVYNQGAKMPLTSMGPWTGQDFEWYDVNWTCPLQEMVPQPQGESPLTAEERRQWKNAKATQY